MTSGNSGHAHSTRDVATGLAFVAGAVLFQAAVVGLSGVLLSVLLLVSFGMWLRGRWGQLDSVRGPALLMTGAFVLHATEEFLGGLPELGPALIGRSVSDGRFLFFNAVWLVLFVGSSVRLGKGGALPVLVVLFLAVAGGVGNGVAHLGFVLMEGGYFPGAWTTLPMFVMGVWVLRRLYGSDTGSPPAGPEPSEAAQ